VRVISKILYAYARGYWNKIPHAQRLALQRITVFTHPERGIADSLERKLNEELTRPAVHDPQASRWNP
jgi:hypothetical protein